MILLLPGKYVPEDGKKELCVLHGTSGNIVVFTYLLRLKRLFTFLLFGAALSQEPTMEFCCVHYSANRQYSLNMADTCQLYTV